jgi:hypothetical protein
MIKIIHSLFHATSKTNFRKINQKTNNGAKFFGKGYKLKVA